MGPAGWLQMARHQRSGAGDSTIRKGAPTMRLNRALSTLLAAMLAAVLAGCAERIAPPGAEAPESPEEATRDGSEVPGVGGEPEVMAQEIEPIELDGLTGTGTCRKGHRRNDDGVANAGAAAPTARDGASTKAVMMATAAGTRRWLWWR